MTALAGSETTERGGVAGRFDGGMVNHEVDMGGDLDAVNHEVLLNTVQWVRGLKHLSLSILSLPPPSRGQYLSVMKIWEREKELGRADPTLYTIVMAMCEHMKSAELAISVKEDMERQNWKMDLQ